MAGLSGFVVLLSGGAIVTMLSPRLPRRCQRRETTHAGLTSSAVVPGERRDDARKACRDDSDKVVADGIKLYYCRSIVDERSIGSHGPIFSRKDRKIHPRHQRPAGPSRVRAGAVCLSGQPFPQPRARQHFDGCACRRPLLPHRVLAISPGRDRILCRGAGPRRSRNWALYQRRQFRWKAIEPLQLVLGLSIPALVITHIAGVRLGHTLFGHEKL